MATPETASAAPAPTDISMRRALKTDQRFPSSKKMQSIFFDMQKAEAIPAPALSLSACLTRYLTRTMHSRTFSPMVAEITVEPRPARCTSPVSLTVTTVTSALAHFTSPS